MVVKVKTNDKQVIEINDKTVDFCSTLKHLVEDTGGSETPIPLQTVSRASLEKIVKYCELVNDENPNVSDDFFNMDQSSLLDLVMATNYIGIKPLYDQVCKHIASTLVGKTPEQIRNVFGLENDLTKEDEERIIKENGWK